MRLLPCASCRRHVRLGDHVCPFCGVKLALVAAALAVTGAPALAHAADAGVADAGAEEDGGGGGELPVRLDWDQDRLVHPLYGMPYVKKSSCLCDLAPVPSSSDASAAGAAAAASALLLARRRRRKT